ncbi:MAG: hypothetical protein MK209_03165 [Planctomycetes bacterium]|nr:hypothetical protein [Planctomycetota bacterium]
MRTSVSALLIWVFSSGVAHGFQIEAVQSRVEVNEFGIQSLPENDRGYLGRVSVRALRREGFTKCLGVESPSGKAIWIVAQSGVRDVAVARAANLLRFFLAPVQGARWGGAKDKAAVADRMARNGALLMMPEGEHREGREPDLPAQPLYEDETPIEGSRWYLESDWDHRDAAFEEIFHLVHDEGIGTYRPGALPEFQKMIDREARAAIEDRRWGIPIEPGVRQWLRELEDEDSLAQEYIASVIDSYYGLWGAFDERPGGMWGIYCAKTREEMSKFDPQGMQLLEQFLPTDLRGYEALVDPDFEGDFDLRFSLERPWSHHAQYLVWVRLTGGKPSNLIGNRRDNILQGNSANNSIEGGDGQDTLRLLGKRSEYEIKRLSDAVQVIDQIAGRGGSDTLRSIEFFQFAGSDPIAVTELEMNLDR